MQNNQNGREKRPEAGMMGPRHGGPGGPMGARITREKPKNTGKTLRRLLVYLGRNKMTLILMLISVILTAGASLCGPVLQGEAVNILAGQSERQLPVILTLIGVIYLVSSGLTYIQGRLSARLSQQTVYALRHDLFEKISHLPVSYTDHHQHGDIMSRMTNDVDNISTSVSQSVSSLFSAAVTLTGAIVVMLIYSPLLTIVACLTIPLTVFVSSKLAGVMRKYFVRRQIITGQLNGHVEEMVTGYQTVMAFGREKSSVGKFTGISRELRDCSMKANVFGGIMGPLMNVIGNLGYVLVAIAGGLLALGKINPDAARGIALIGPLLVSQAITVGTIQTMIGYTKQITRPINEIANQYAQILTAIAGAERVFGIMDEEPEIDCGAAFPGEIAGKIDFDHVIFSYVPEHPVLRDFDLHIRAGEKIALVGATGSGKTTVVNLLTRFYEIDSGKICIDGTDIRDIRKDDIRHAIAIVLQDTVLFSDTIAKNILYGREEASTRDMEFAAAVSGADHFIRRLPAGYQTELSEQGNNISQGQRQLLAITRAVIADPKILILDEATSNVDTRTEMQIQSALVNLMKNRTSIIIAHRLSTIRDADRIVVIRDGSIAEIGNHEQLLAAGGEYRKLYHSQFAGFET